MMRLLKSCWLVIEKAMTAVLWLHDSIMLYLALFWLMPLIALVMVSVFIYDLRPLMRDQIGTLYSMLGLPPWLGFCLYTELHPGPTTRQIKHWMRRAPIYIGFILLSAGGLLWLLGVI